MHELPNFDIENSLRASYKLIAGIDEAGRGCLAGPVVSAAVILPDILPPALAIDDSKKLTPKKREELELEIIKFSIAFKISFVDNKIIDDINILNATIRSMNDAINGLSSNPDYLLIDGNYFKGSNFPFQTVIKGDTKSLTIASASILAKVSRDRFMTEIADKEFPEYGFAKHKGYATREHFYMIDKYGICKYHRETFLRKHFNRQLEIF